MNFKMLVVMSVIKYFFLIWFVVLFANQVFIFEGCFYTYCIFAALLHTGIISLIITWIIVYFKFLQKSNNIGIKPPVYQKTYGLASRQSTPKVRNRYSDNYLKSKGDKYERYIGRKLEEKGELVIYHGLMLDYDDKGVDIISISKLDRRVNLVQCKNWTNKTMYPDEFENIYTKLSNYQLSYRNLDIDLILEHLTIKIDIKLIESLIDDSFVKYETTKTLYVATDRVVDLAIGEYMYMVKSNIFRYKDMKVVFTYEK